MKAEGKTAWDELHGVEGFDNFSSRRFLEAVLPELSFATDEPTAMEYGCGTGPGACFLAERGFRVDAIDLVPLAIEMAQDISSRRGLDIHFGVADICNLGESEKQYDLIVDSYCLQCIVFDDERKRVFSAVRSRLKPGGYYLISTAFLDREHEQLIGSATVEDRDSGVVYTQYGSGLIDLRTGIVIRLLRESQCEYPDTVRIADQLYIPHRRHLGPSALHAELAASGFAIEFLDDKYAGNIACSLKEGVA